ncbi:claudin-34-like [Thamnophis elegans]|uniref:claudin-34-like n=1 Tax=Thamnophis elegans TaxID=35005 RepID=UPI0013781F09|nr:claudin-34-like [Thamnophis elegans]
MRSNEGILPTSSKFMYMTNKPLNWQAPSETESMITKWSVWINRAQFGGYLLSILGWILCITSTATDYWRLWHVKSKDNLYPGLLWIGIWRACYLHSTHPQNRYVHCEEFTEDLKKLPNEIFLAQDLLSLCCIVGAVGITFMSFALWNVVRAITHKTFLLTLFNVGGLMNFLTGIIILIPIAWNSYSILINADIMFPESFNMPTSPVYQEIGAAIYIGYVSALLLIVSGVMIMCNKRVFQSRRENLVLSPGIGSLATIDMCGNIGSSGTIDQRHKEEPELLRPDAVTSVHHVDIKKESVQSMQQQLLEDAKEVPIVLVTPYVVESQVEGEEAVKGLDSTESHPRRKHHRPD